MSADLLRRAAALMRERAEKATPSADPVPGGWAGYSRDEDLGDARIFGGPAEDGYRTGTVLEFTEYVDCDNCIRPSNADVEHISSWHPTVALAVADWLDWTAADGDMLVNHFGAYDEDELPRIHRHAFALASAYLGETS